MHTIETYKPVVSTNPLVQLLHWVFYRFKRNLPQNWNELTAEQLCVLPEIIIHKEITQTEAQVLIADKFLKLPAWVMRTFTDEQLLALIQPLEFIFQKSELTTTIVKKFPCAGRTYYGPSDYWFDVEFGQYKDVLKYLKYYSDTKDELYMRIVLSVIYRPHNWRGKFKKYDPGEITDRSVLFKNLDPYFIEALMFQVYGCLANIEQEFAEVFEEGEENGDIESLVLSLSGGAFGDYENTFHQPVWLVMHEMRRLILEDRKKEKQQQ